jgi:ATP-dependent Clp protease ATP-binding subunit ClpA
VTETPHGFDRFDLGARRVLQRARDAAESAGLPYVGTEHLLLGLLAQPRTVARRALRVFGLDLEEARAGLDRLRATSPEYASATPEPQGLTADAKRAIELGVASSRAARQAEIGPANLLLGLIDLDGGLATEYLRQRGINVQALRARTVQLTTVPLTRVPRRIRESVFEPTLGTTTRNNVVMCRLDDGAIEAIDTLIEAGVRANRSDAAAWLITIGLESKSAVLDAVKDKVEEIRRIREDARALAEDAEAHD